MLKAMLCALFLVGGTMAFGQSAVGGSGLNAQPIPLQFQSNPRRAARVPMGSVENLLESSDNVHAQGVRPLWELAPVAQETPLGDTARLLRKEHAAKKKANFVVTD